jgi:endosialidase-like protein
VNFDWNPSNPPELHLSSGHQTGLIAQQVEKIFPEMVSIDKDGYRRVNYGLLPYLLLESVRELKAGNDSLRADARTQRKQNEQARAEIAKLRRAAATTDTRVARLARSSAAKDAQIALMSIEIEQLRKEQQQMAVLLARFVPPQGEHGKSQTAAARPAVDSPTAQVADVAHARF